MSTEARVKIESLLRSDEEIKEAARSKLKTIRFEIHMAKNIDNKVENLKKEYDDLKSAMKALYPDFEE